MRAQSTQDALKLPRGFCTSAATSRWAYCYENRVGYEMTVRFSKDGTRTSVNSVDHGELDEKLQLGDSDADRDYLRSKLPLGKLAKLPLAVPPRAPEPPALPPSTEKVQLTVAVPKRVLNEAQAVADVADRSLNWRFSRPGFAPAAG